MGFSYAAIFIASLFGSVHCVGMCGGFATFCASMSRKPTLSLCSYHAGRFTVYCILGAIAAFVGMTLDNSAMLLGIQRLSALLTGLLLILWGSAKFLNVQWLSNVSPHLINDSKLLQRILRWIHSPGSPLLKTFSLGLFSGLLPCGWLYTYVALAATTGSPFYGALLMSAFWVGTVPILTLVASLSSIALGSLQKFAPKLTAIFLIAGGIFSLASHFGWIGDHSDHASHHVNPTHHKHHN